MIKKLFAKLNELHWSGVVVLLGGAVCFTLILCFAPQDRIDFIFPHEMRVTLRDMVFGANGLVWAAFGIRAVMTKREDAVRRSFAPAAIDEKAEETKP